MRRVVITGIGVVSPFGIGCEKTWQGVCSGRSALRSTTQPLRGCQVIGAVPEGVEKGEWNLDGQFNQGDRRQMSRGTLMALTAVEEAMLGNEGDDHLNESTGVAIGIGIADLAITAETTRLLDTERYTRVSPYFVPRILANMAAGEVSMRYGFRGPLMAPSTACSAGVQAIGEAAALIRTGRARRMIAGGFDACITPLAIAGFARLRALTGGSDPAIASRPFHRSRDGFVLSEGGAVLLLEAVEVSDEREDNWPLQDAEERGATVIAEILGIGMAADAHHLTSPHPDGIGARLCMERALSDADIRTEQVNGGVDLDIRTEQVDYVNAHATSTPIGDRVEAMAIAALIPGVAVSSIKGHIGHTLAGAGAIETAMSAMAIRDGLMPGTLNLNGESDIDVDLDLLSHTTHWKRTIERRIALCNSFGFGGANASLCLAEYHPRYTLLMNIHIA